MTNKKHTSFPHSPLKLASFVIVAIFFIFVAVFLISAANGFKIEITNAKVSFKKTGTIILTSQPSGAKIYLDNKLVSKTTGSNLFPTKLKGIFPGKHRLRIEKDSFITWEKEIEIIEETVTWANYITMYPTNPVNEKLFDEKIIKIKESTDQKKAILIIKTEVSSEISVLDFSNLNKNKIYTFPLGIETRDILWSEDSSKILLTTMENGITKNTVLKIAQENKDPLELEKIPNLSFDKIIWNQADSNTLLASKEGNLFKVNVNDKSVSSNIAEKIISFDSAVDKSLYYTKEEKENIVLIKADSDGKNQKTIVKSLPKSKNYKVQASKNNDKLLITVNHDIRTVYLADKIDGPLELTQINQNATNAEWSPNGTRVLLSNEHDAWTYDIEKKKIENVITNSNITNIRWDFSNDRVIATVENQCLSLEFDGTNKIIFDNCKSEGIMSFEHKFYLFLGEGKFNDYLEIYKRV